ncbi:MAG: helix-turn-helix transcriptional regulator [Bosea sp.]|uniref:winged helix-turn-helix transcriptional regulator n=1 Tax=Bosea sp. (in: a-proteobacteria) TaxID=1871050 RepID=UPI002392267A|nr:helix-turn-helix transcriptional regulator [Bosea sp. (in: a-proteobacteria)]MCP4738726.1 helix-turn-helix transcriptional regulator [Bosea sp. (in: a-proteobacteria)]
MTSYGQFCAMARAHETLGGRWTLLIVREILCGSSRFNDIRRGIPRISKTMLSERLQALVQAGALRRSEGAAGPDYALTEAGLELAELVKAMGVWGQRWLPRQAEQEDLDLEPVLVDIQRRVRFSALPDEPLVIRFEITGQPIRFLLLKRREVSFCSQNPGFPEALIVRGPLSALVAWWRGDVSFVRSGRLGLSLSGPRELIRAFPGWFELYLFAGVAPAHRDERASA